MKLLSCEYKGETFAAVSDGKKAYKAAPDMYALLDRLEGALPGPELLAGEGIDLGELRLLAPIPEPRQDVICLGMNYMDHSAEAAKWGKDDFVKNAGKAVYFSKRVSEAGKPDGVIPRHAGLTDRLDYEAELAVVLGKAARDVKAVDAADCIFGYTVLNDVSARDLQTGHKQWYFGKSLDGFTPMGPVLVTADEIAYPPALEITSRVNGELRQKSNTALLITSIGQILEELTEGMTLLPGTIIATGTPAGVGMGFDPPRFLQSGDTVECAIEGIGTLCSTVI